MATIGSSNVGFLLKNQMLSMVRTRCRNPFAGRLPFGAAIRASTSVTLPFNPDPAVDEKIRTRTNVLACPICYGPLIQKEYRASISGSGFHCHTCKKDYFNNDIYRDLTVASGAKEYDEPMPISTELFSLKWLEVTLNPLKVEQLLMPAVEVGCSQGFLLSLECIPMLLLWIFQRICSGNAMSSSKEPNLG